MALDVFIPTTWSDAVEHRRKIAEATNLLRDQATSLETRLGTAEANITSLLSRMTAAEANISDLQTRMAAQEAYWTSYTPTVAATVGSITAYSVSGQWKKFTPQLLFVRFNYIISNNGSGAGGITVSVPSGLNAAASGIGVAREIAVAGYLCSITANGASMGVQKYDNTYPGGNSHNVVGEVIYALN